MYNILFLCDMDDILEHVGLIHRREFSLHECYSEGSLPVFQASVHQVMIVMQHKNS